MLDRMDHWLRRRSFDWMVFRKYAEYRRDIDLSRPSLVVFQMGKVGSSTVTATLRAGLPSHNVFQIHFLSLEWIKRVEDQYRQASKDHGRMFVDAHLLTSKFLNDVYNRPEKGWKKWQLISLVREPVARNLSSFFQAFPVYFSKLSLTSDADAVNGIDPAELGRTFINEFGEYRHSIPTVWFQTHIQPMFGIDVYAHPFESAKGYSIIEGESARLLLIRAEDVDRVFLEAFEVFQGIRLPTLIRSNDAMDKVYAATYRETKRLVELPEEYVDSLYSSQYMRHFYGEEEIRMFRDRWLGAGAAGS
jgi:hypothetical protein